MKPFVSDHADDAGLQFPFLHQAAQIGSWVRMRMAVLVWSGTGAHESRGKMVTVLFLDGFSSLLSSFSERDVVGRTEGGADAGAPRCVAQGEAELMSVRGSLRTGRPFGASE